MQKFATFEVISSVLVAERATPEQAEWFAGQGSPFFKQAHRAIFTYEPKAGFLYVRSRAISSRCNDNFDEFPAEEIKKAYASFIGKPVFVNHHNENHRRMRGVCIDAALHEDYNPDGSPDTWAEVLMEVDARTFPKLAEAIIKRHIERTSMGTDVAYSICSACGNKATSPAEYCVHIPRQKGQRLYRTTASGKKEGVLIREVCYGLGFFENSLLVEPPADPTAYLLGGVDTRGLDKSASAIPLSNEDRQGYRDFADAGARDSEMHAHNESRVVNLGDPNDLKSHLLSAHGWEDHDFWRNSHPANHPAMDPASSDDRPLRAHEIRGAHDHEHDVEYPEDYEGAMTLGDSHFHTASRTAAGTDLGLRMKTTTDTCSNCHHDLDRHHISGSGDLECNSCACHTPLSGPPAGHTGSLRSEAGPMATEEGGRKDRHKGRVTDSCAKCGSDIYQLKGETNWQHDIDAGAGIPHMAEPGGMGKSAVQGPKYPDPSQHPKWQAANLSSDHIVEHYQAAHPHEVAAGKSWYSDAHHLAKTIAGNHPHPEGAAHVGAGVLSAYSPQNNWPANIFAAHRSFREGRAIGPGEGPTVMGMHQNAAAKIMGGMHHQEALKGPKTQDFAHLIEHGGNAPGSDRQRVVIDRHALSVAAGRRMGKDEATGLGSAMGNRSYYEHPANLYREAAAKINHGKPADEHVEPHQVQAVTWLVRQRRNSEEDEANENTGARNRARGRGQAEKNVRTKMQDELLEHHPEMKDNSHVQSARLRAQAYGEVKAPSDVDTLRDEECPVCGESDSYDGNRCQVCGFIAPPAMFQDPDLDMAKQLDLRKDVAQDAGSLPGQPANGGLPGEVPGEGVPGSDAVPVDPSLINPDGTVAPTTDPEQIAEQQAQQLADGEPIMPDQIGPDGQVPIGPDGAVPVPMQGEPGNGQPFTPGTNAPGDPQGVDPDEPVEVPGGVNGPESPLTEKAEGVDPSDTPFTDGQAPAEQGGDPGTPDDGVPDLQCPACGFQADAAQPESTNMDLPNDPGAAEGSDGMLAGDVCPNCQQAQLVSVGEDESGQGPPPPPAV